MDTMSSRKDVPIINNIINLKNVETETDVRDRIKHFSWSISLNEDDGNDRKDRNNINDKNDDVECLDGDTFGNDTEEDAHKNKVKSIHSQNSTDVERERRRFEIVYENERKNLHRQVNTLKTLRLFQWNDLKIMACNRFSLIERMKAIASECSISFITVLRACSTMDALEFNDPKFYIRPNQVLKELFWNGNHLFGLNVCFRKQLEEEIYLCAFLQNAIHSGFGTNEGHKETVSKVLALYRERCVFKTFKHEKKRWGNALTSIVTQNFNIGGLADHVGAFNNYFRLEYEDENVNDKKFERFWLYVECLMFCMHFSFMESYTIICAITDTLKMKNKKFKKMYEEKRHKTLVSTDCFLEQFTKDIQSSDLEKNACASTDIYRTWFVNRDTMSFRNSVSVAAVIKSLHTSPDDYLKRQIESVQSSV